MITPVLPCLPSSNYDCSLILIMKERDRLGIIFILVFISYIVVGGACVFVAATNDPVLLASLFFVGDGPRPMSPIVTAPMSAVLPGTMSFSSLPTLATPLTSSRKSRYTAPQPPTPVMGSFNPTLVPPPASPPSTMVHTL